jgi:hypothetical protein
LYVLKDKISKDIKEACSLALVSAGAPPGYNKPPDIVLVILPLSAADIRQDVKRAGDVTLGVGIVINHNFLGLLGSVKVSTQCVVGSVCYPDH